MSYNYNFDAGDGDDSPPASPLPAELRHPPSSPAQAEYNFDFDENANPSDMVQFAPVDNDNDNLIEDEDPNESKYESRRASMPPIASVPPDSSSSLPLPEESSNIEAKTLELELSPFEVDPPSPSLPPPMAPPLELSPPSNNQPIPPDVSPPAPSSSFDIIMGKSLSIPIAPPIDSHPSSSPPNIIECLPSSVEITDSPSISSVIVDPQAPPAPPLGPPSLDLADSEEFESIAPLPPPRKQSLITEKSVSVSSSSSLSSSPVDSVPSPSISSSSTSIPSPFTPNTQPQRRDSSSIVGYGSLESTVQLGTIDGNMMGSTAKDAYSEFVKELPSKPIARRDDEDEKDEKAAAEDVAGLHSEFGLWNAPPSAPALDTALYARTPDPVVKLMVEAAKLEAEEKNARSGRQSPKSDSHTPSQNSPRNVAPSLAARMAAFENAAKGPPPAPRPISPKGPSKFNFLGGGEVLSELAPKGVPPPPKVEDAPPPIPSFKGAIESSPSNNRQSSLLSNSSPPPYAPPSPNNVVLSVNVGSPGSPGAVSELKSPGGFMYKVDDDSEGEKSPLSPPPNVAMSDASPGAPVVPLQVDSPLPDIRINVDENALREMDNFHNPLFDADAEHHDPPEEVIKPPDLNRKGSIHALRKESAAAAGKEPLEKKRSDSRLSLLQRERSRAHIPNADDVINASPLVVVDEFGPPMTPPGGAGIGQQNIILNHRNSISIITDPTIPNVPPPSFDEALRSPVLISNVMSEEKAPMGRVAPFELDEKEMISPIVYGGVEASPYMAAGKNGVMRHEDLHLEDLADMELGPQVEGNPRLREENERLLDAQERRNERRPGVIRRMGQDRINDENEAPETHVPILAWTMGIVHIGVFVVLMFENGWSFESQTNNPLFGPTVSVLVTYGAKDAYRVLNGEAWRLVSSLLLHSGIIQLVANILGVIFTVSPMESAYGTWKCIAILLVSGIFGELLSCLVNPSMIGVGGSAALMGFTGAMWGELFHNYKLVQGSMTCYVIKLIIQTIVEFIIGFVPLVDNWCILGSFVAGTLIASILFARTKVDPDNGDRSRNYCLLGSSALTLAAIYGLAAIFVFKDYGGNPTEFCSSCTDFSCYPTTEWNCNTMGELCGNVTYC